jgi:hypothetical protein
MVIATSELGDIRNGLVKMAIVADDSLAVVGIAAGRKRERKLDASVARAFSLGSSVPREVGSRRC